MVVEVERVVTVDAPIEAAWEVLADPARRARAISVVDSYRVEGQEYVWQVELPIPLIRRTISVRTRDEERDPPAFVRFAGDSKAFTVEGEHELTALENGTRVRSRFSVDGKLPGVERYFERNIDAELSNLLASIDAEAV